MSEKMDLCGSLNWDPSISITSTMTKFLIHVRLPSDNVEDCLYGKWTAMIHLLSGTTKRVVDGERNIPIFLEFLMEEARELAKGIRAGTVLEIFRGVDRIGEIVVLDYDHAA
jgi:hypothetical protein